MQIKQLILASGFLLCSCFQLSAQEGTEKAKSDITHPKNMLKVNLTALVLKNYSVTYERVLTKKISFAFSYRTMPLTSVPFKSSIIKAIDDDDIETKNAIDKVRVGNFAITPEVRFYLSRKGYGKGFYIAPFYRYAKFKVEQLNYDYDDNSVNKTVSISGDVTANTGGIMFGAQWFLGKHIALDWWILGPHYGSGNGNFVGKASHPLTQADQDDLRDDLEDIDLPLTDKIITVNASGATVKLDGPWAGIRAGISIGIRF